MLKMVFYPSLQEKNNSKTLTIPQHVSLPKTNLTLHTVVLKYAQNYLLPKEPGRLSGC